MRWLKICHRYGGHMVSLFIVLVVLRGPGTCFSQESGGSLKKEAPLRLTNVTEEYEARLLFLRERGIVHFQVVPKKTGQKTTLSMSKRTELWKSLLEQVLREYGHRETYLVTVGEYPELNYRIAYTAASSDNWNTKTGRPRVGSANNAIKQFLLQNNLTPELEAFFGAYEYKVSVQSAEAVMLCRGREINSASFSQVATRQLQPQSLLPCGASILFRLTANNGGK